jgi:predicted unusual protein kinase regulating ubiquinone biosynthesis (AarF/ABC1/UbiB family)
MQTRSRRLRQSAARFRSLAVQMGGVMIKMGQFFSSRVDVLPSEITAELADLQDEVPPEDFNDLVRVAQAEFDIPLEEIFLEINPQPLAAASLGQVHSAKIRDPENNREPKQVVVKIQRPNIEVIIDTDLAALHTVGKWLHRYSPIRRRADVPSLMDEFTRILHEEVDYLVEGEHAEIFAKNFAEVPEVRVPKVFWTFTTRRVLTLEDVQAIKINDYAGIERAGIDRREVARCLLNTYLKQIFEDGFFHADPHPGNLFVCPSGSPRQTGEAGQAWQLTFIDFGMIGRVRPKMKEGMREMVIAVGTRDAARLVNSYRLLGILLPEADLDLLEKAEAELFDRFWGKNMTELTQVSLEEISQLTMQFRELMYTLPFQIPEDLILLGRTVGILSGMCTGLDPKFNVWENIAPFAKKLIAEDEANGSSRWLETLTELARRLMDLPRRTEYLLNKVERGELVVQNPLLVDQTRRLTPPDGPAQADRISFEQSRAR